jgi:hypothetical protein
VDQIKRGNRGIEKSYDEELNEIRGEDMIVGSIACMREMRNG